LAASVSGGDAGKIAGDIFEHARDRARREAAEAGSTAIVRRVSPNLGDAR
jgi:hypothetical protein